MRYEWRSVQNHRQNGASHNSLKINKKYNLKISTCSCLFYLVEEPVAER